MPTPPPAYKTFDEWMKAAYEGWVLYSSSTSAPPTQRCGQWFYNHLWDAMLPGRDASGTWSRGLVQRLADNKADPFYTDDNLGSFFVYLSKHWDSLRD